MGTAKHNARTKTANLGQIAATRPKRPYHRGTLLQLSDPQRHYCGQNEPGVAVEITIGVQHIARDLSLDVDTSKEELAKQLSEALEKGGLIELTDTRGREVLIPAATIGYIEIGPEETRRVGFGSL
jgi:hypothetical protein